MNEFALEIAKLTMLRWHLQRRGIHDRRVLRAMAQVPRERFVGPEWRSEAYADRALSIGCDQTISQPFIVALMTQALKFTGHERVLEVGTGSGYQTAVLAELACAVASIERHASLSHQAAGLLDELGYRNVTLLVGDGTLGHPDAAPYDRILVAAAAAQVPPALVEQLAEDGILVIPLGDPERQVLATFHKLGGVLKREDLSGCRFVPLIGAQGWPPRM